MSLGATGSHSVMSLSHSIATLNTSPVFGTAQRNAPVRPRSETMNASRPPSQPSKPPKDTLVKIEAGRRLTLPPPTQRKPLDGFVNAVKTEPAETHARTPLPEQIHGVQITPDAIEIISDSESESERFERNSFPKRSHDVRFFFHATVYSRIN